MTQVIKDMGNMAGIYNGKPRALHSNTQQTLPDHSERHPITQNFLRAKPPCIFNTQALFIQTTQTPFNPSNIRRTETASTRHPKNPLFTR